MNKKSYEKIEQASYALALALHEAAQELCETRDTSGIHFLVSKERKAANLPRHVKLRFGVER